MSTPMQEVLSPSRPVPAGGPASVLGRIRPELLEKLAGRITLTGSRHNAAPVTAPYTGEVIRELPLCTAEDVKEAIRRAREAQKAWAATSFKERARVFLRMHDLVLERQDEVLDIIQLESGKARKHAFEEVADTAITSRYYAMHAEDHLGPQRRKGALPGLTTTWEYHQPLGVVGFIAPWNYPLTLSIGDAIAALMAGNAVVIKPDQQTPFTALWAADALYECGLPAGLVQVVTGRGRELGTPMIEGVEYIGFTGSTPTGRIIARQAGERLIGCSLELGGKNPMLVLADADLDRTVEGALRACFSNSGQLCISIERMYVHSSIYDRFLARFAERTKAMKLAATFDYEADMGSLISRDQVEKMEQHIREAVAKGATVAAGGKARPDLGPLFFEPTILVGVTEQMEVCRDETFGPLVSVYKFETVDEALEKANDTRYGLNASIWSDDVDEAVKLAARVQSGTVNINEGYAAAWASVDAPMGGFKESGLGRRHGAQGILRFTEAQTISVQHLMGIGAPKGVSDKNFARAMTEALKVLKHIPGVR